ncbi:MAG: DUF2007 domain-containing protein [Chloroflexi bacterium]|nr:DUF2007 domain-containing protein [Chloroflexota bacterium]
MKWTYLATASGQLEAELWRNLLEEEAIDAMLMAGDTSTFLGIAPKPVRVLVDETKIYKAKQLLEERLQQVLEDEEPLAGDSVE